MGRRASWFGLLAVILSAVLALPVVPSTAAAPQMVTVVWNDSFTSASFVRSAYDGSSRVELASPSSAGTPVLSPDRSALAYSSPTGVRVLKVSGGNPKLVLAAGDYDQPAWSADSSSVVVVRRLSALAEEVLVAAGDGSQFGVIFSEDPATLSGLASVGWSPDGSKVVLTAYQDVGTGKPRLVHVTIPSSGGSQTEMTGVVGVSFSPDGGRAYAARRTSGDVQIVRLGASLTPVEVVQTYSNAPAGWVPEIRWSADGSRVGVLGLSGTRNASLSVFTAGGKLVRRYLDLPNEGTGMAYRALALSPDGAVISMYGKTTTLQFQFEGLYLLDTVANRSCLVTDIYQIGADHTGRFGADGRTLFIEGGNRLRSRSIVKPDAKVRTVPLGGPADVVGFLSAPVRGVTANPCPLTPVSRGVDLDPRRTSVRAYVYATSPASCRDGVPVKLQRRRSDGTWATVASAKTNSDNTAVFDRPRSGTYRALAPRVVRGNYACLAATSDRYRL